MGKKCNTPAPESLITTLTNKVNEFEQSLELLNLQQEELENNSTAEDTKHSDELLALRSEIGSLRELISTYEKAIDKEKTSRSSEDASIHSRISALEAKKAKDNIDVTTLQSSLVREFHDRLDAFNERLMNITKSSASCPELAQLIGDLRIENIFGGSGSGTSINGSVYVAPARGISAGKQLGITNFRVVEQTNGSHIFWDFLEEDDNISYSELEISDNGTVGKYLSKVAYPTSTYTALHTGKKFFRVRAVDNNGTFSGWSAWQSATALTDVDTLIGALTTELAQSEIEKIVQGQVPAIVEALNHRLEGAMLDAKGKAEELVKTVENTVKERINEAKEVAREAQQDVDEIRRETNDRVNEAERIADELKASMDTKIQAAKEGITRELIDQVAQDGGIVSGEINTLKRSTENALSAIREELTNKVGDNGSLTQELLTMRNELTDRVRGIAKAAIDESLLAKSELSDGELTAINEKLAALKTEINDTLNKSLTKETNKVTEDLNSRVQAINELLRKYEQTTATALGSKASSTAVDTLNQEVTKQGEDLKQVNQKITTVEGKLGNIVDGRLQQWANSIATEALNQATEMVDGKLQAETSKLLALENTVAGLKNEVLQEATNELKDYSYSKAETDTTVAGKLQEYNSKLTIGGSNLWSVVENPLVIDTGILVKDLKSVSEEYFRLTIQGFNANLVIASLRNALVHKDILWEEGDDFVLSFEIRGNRQAIADRMFGYFGSNNSKNVFNSTTEIKPPVVTTEWERYEYPIKAFGTGKASSDHLFGFGFRSPVWSVGDWIEVRHVQMQRGTKATSFSKSAYLDTKKIEADSKALESLKTKTDQMDAKLTTTADKVTTLESKITGLDNKADAQALDALTTKVDNRDTGLKALADRLTTLRSTVDAMDGTLRRKADATALDAYATKAEQSRALTTHTQNLTSAIGTAKTEATRYTQTEVAKLNNSISTLTTQYNSLGNIYASKTQLTEAISNNNDSLLQEGSKFRTEFDKTVKKLQENTHTKLLDLRNLNQDTWFPVTVLLTSSKEPQLISVYKSFDMLNDKATWAANASGFTLNFSVYSIAEGWSGYDSSKSRRVVEAGWKYTKDGVPPLLYHKTWRQISSDSTEIFYLRGGASYEVTVSKDIPLDNIVLHTQRYTARDGRTLVAELKYLTFNEEVKDHYTPKTDQAAIESVIDTKITSLSGPTGVVTRLQTDLTSKLGGLESKVSEYKQSLDGVSAGWGVTVDNNGVVSGVSLLSGKNTKPTFAVNANTFYITTPGSANTTKPFIVDRGITYIDGAKIKNASVDIAAIKNLKVSNAHIDNASIGFSKLKDVAITNGHIKGVLQSDNYIAGRQGWKLDKSGTFEINSTINGSRVHLTANGLVVYYENGQKAVEIGIF